MGSASYQKLLDCILLLRKRKSDWKDLKLASAYYTLPKFQEYLEDTIFSRMVLLYTLLSLRVSIWSINPPLLNGESWPHFMTFTIP